MKSYDNWGRFLKELLSSRKEEKQENQGNDRKVSLTLIIRKVIELIMLETISRHMRGEERMFFISTSVRLSIHNGIIDKLMKQRMDE